MAKTICVQCKHHEGIEDGHRTDCWYNHFCKHPETLLIRDIDPVTGVEGYAKVNSLGTPYLTDSPFPYCRDINHGNCPRYERRQ